ncbi:translation factor [Streptococcus pneumoniae]|nr:translation factor [Streptococcus pneumoniae]
MVSMVDKDGKLIPEQGGARSTSPAPVVIRKGLDIDIVKRNENRTNR